MYNKIIIALGTLVIVASVSVFSYSVYKEKQIDTMQKDAISKITSFVDLKDYRKKEKKEISDIIGEVSDKISKTGDGDEIDKLVASAEKTIKKISTDKELTAKEKKAAEKRKAAEEQASAYNDNQPAYSGNYGGTPSYSGSGTNNSGGSNSGGCVGNDAASFY